MTPYEKYIKKLQGLKDTSEGHIAGSVNEMQNVIYDALLEWMDNTLEYKNGELVASLETMDLLNDFSESFKRTITKLEPYKKGVSDLIKSLPSLGDAITDHQKKVSGIDPKKAGISEVQKIVTNQVIDAFTDNGLNANIVQPLRDLLHQNISSGTRLQDAKKTLKDFVKGGNDKSGKVKRYMNMTAQQAVDGYTGAINKRLMDVFPFKHMIISGSLIATSSPQCRFAIKNLNGIITKEQFEKQIIPIAEDNGLIEGTTFQNLPLNKLHWGCRHEFTPIMLNEGDKIGANEVYEEGKVKSVEEFDKPGNLKALRPKKTKPLYSDITGASALKEFLELAASKVSTAVKKKGFEKLLAENVHEIRATDKKTGSKVVLMQGSRYDKSELTIADSLSKEGFHIVFPPKGTIEKDKEGRRKKNNDVEMIDTKTYYRQKTELKQLRGLSSETIRKQIQKDQAPVIAYDVQSGISKRALIRGLQSGWTANTKKLMVKWKGKWVELEKDQLFSKKVETYFN